MVIINNDTLRKNVKSILLNSFKIRCSLDQLKKTDSGIINIIKLHLDNINVETTDLINGTLGYNKENNIVALVRVDSVNISYALQQMIGFKMGKWSDIEELISSMDLSKDEWEHIKIKESSGSLDDDDIIEIDEYFKDKNNKK